jgi:hypothetical protein
MELDKRRFAIPSLWETSGLQRMTGSLLCIKTPLPNEAHSFSQHNAESRERCVLFSTGTNFPETWRLFFAVHSLA